MTERFIPVAAPVLAGNEKKYVNDCLDSGWISSVGKYIPLFEQEFARFCGVKHAISCSNGTVALHLALLGLGIGPGDEVIVPTFTYVASANCVLYAGARPVFVDCEAETWNIDPALIEQAITSRTKAILAVHIFGHPADMNPIQDLARKYNLVVIEDAAEAIGATYHGRLVGSIGQAGTFSFFGNKIITTGEGGMLTTDDDQLAGRIRQLKGQGMDPERRYWFPILGYNYRMTNVQAAIGLAQLEQAEWHLEQRRRVRAAYRTRLASHPGLYLQPEKPGCRNSYWMIGVLLGNDWPDCGHVMDQLAAQGIETRPFFHPMHTLPVYREYRTTDGYPQAERISARGILLPSSGNLTEEDIQFVCDTLDKVRSGTPAA